MAVRSGIADLKLRPGKAPTWLTKRMKSLATELFRILLDEVNSPRLKICLDTGHANIYSKIPIKDWIGCLGKDIPYMHVDDNLGDIDNHLAAGDGNINWTEFSESIKEADIYPQIVFEGVTLENTMKSIDYFRKEGIYPFTLDKLS